MITATEEQEAADRAAVEAAYLRYWDVYQNMSNIPASERETRFAEVATGPELEEMRRIVQNADKHHLQYVGTVVNRLSWPTAINGDKSAVIINCQDQSKLKLIKDGDETKFVIGPERGRTDITLSKGMDGAWRVLGVFQPPGAAC